MIDYETFCRITALHRQQHLRVSQIARMLGLNRRTVIKWIEAGSYQPRQGGIRAGKLDPYKPLIIRWLDTYPYTATQIFQRLCEEGYAGGMTIVKEYISKIRPRKTKAFLTLSFAPGECAQVDWGEFGSVAVGSTRRKLSFFVMVLCYSRMMYIEFTVSQKTEQFLACHQNAFNYFGGVPEKIMIDNLKSAVIKRLVGQGPVFNPRYLDFAHHYGFTIAPCGVGKANEKGRVENAVGYIKKNFLAGLDIPDFSAVNPEVNYWLEHVANVRVHGTTHQQPVHLFKQEQSALRPLPMMLYEVATSRQVRATNRFRVVLDTNHYSVPSEYASALLTLKAYPDRLCIYYGTVLIAQHPRSYDRHQDFEDPDHPRALLQQRRSAREQRLLTRFLKLSPKAEEYYQQLTQRRMNPRHHIRQIVALSEIYGQEKVARALEDAFTFHAFSCEYIANILEQRQRILPQPGALHLTRRQDLLEIDIPEPNLDLYEDQHQQEHNEEGDISNEQ